ncbi:hypothetical protein ACFVWR_02350 [Leifsonia sp. NPDC058292]|uniref:hypothetical protein n=1 Tax=Leifsonia sp. NPDC058292 TaxID=3346428 RepID=UPI0036DD34B5
MRLVSVREKTIAVVVLMAVNGLLILVLNAFSWAPGSIVVSLLQLIGWYLATRVFRGAGEPVAPARPWWRMTARPLLSGVWAVLYAIGVVTSLIALAFVQVTAADVVSILVQGALAVLFTLSFLRLRAQHPAATPNRAATTRTARPRPTDAPASPRP